MVIKYAFILALGSSVLTGCVVHAEPRVVVYDGHRPPIYRIDHYPRPMIYPLPRHYPSPHFKHHHGRG